MYSCGLRRAFGVSSVERSVEPLKFSPSLNLNEIEHFSKVSFLHRREELTSSDWPDELKERTILTVKNLFQDNKYMDKTIISV